MGCLNHKVKFIRDHYKECLAARKKNGDKSKIACPTAPAQHADCFNTIFTCVTHKDEPANVRILQKKKDAMAKIGWTMGMVTFFPHITSPATRGEHTVNNSASEQTVQKLESVNNLQAETEAGRIDELFSNSKKKGITVLPEPKGRPVFMFFLAKGKHKGVNCFFDNGCSDCVMRVGVPGVEWDGAITKTGPFNMNGVGGMTTTTQDEWMVLAPLASGDMQPLS